MDTGEGTAAQAAKHTVAALPRGALESELTEFAAHLSAAEQRWLALVAEFDRRWGTAGMFGAARVANENTPKLRTFDAKGFRRDVVEFHPAYHGFMAESMKAGCTPRPGMQTARARRRRPRSRVRRAISWWRRSRTATCARSR